MADYRCQVRWRKKPDELFIDNLYCRGHIWEFDDGLEIPATSAPDVVPVPMSVAGNVDPEQAFVASLSSCHMLWFLAIAANKSYVIENYVDNPIGILGKNDEGHMAMTHVTLKPQVTFSPAVQPNEKQLQQLHHLAHKRCFIANSVKTNITIEAIF